MIKVSVSAVIVLQEKVLFCRHWLSGGKSCKSGLNLTAHFLDRGIAQNWSSNLHFNFFFRKLRFSRSWFISLSCYLTDTWSWWSRDFSRVLTPMLFLLRSKPLPRVWAIRFCTSGFKGIFGDKVSFCFYHRWLEFPDDQFQSFRQIIHSITSLNLNKGLVGLTRPDSSGIVYITARWLSAI